MIHRERQPGTQGDRREKAEHRAVVATLLRFRTQFNRIGRPGTLRAADVRDRVVPATALIGDDIGFFEDGQVCFEIVQPFFHTYVLGHIYAFIPRIRLDTRRFGGRKVKNRGPVRLAGCINGDRSRCCTAWGRIELGAGRQTVPVDFHREAVTAGFTHRIIAREAQTAIRNLTPDDMPRVAPGTSDGHEAHDTCCVQ